MMRVITWCKTYPLNLAAILLTLASLVTLMLVHTRGNSFRENMEGRQKEIRRLEQLMNTPKKIPAEKADQPEQTVILTINSLAIEKLKEAYAKMDKEGSEMFEVTVSFNKNRHLPMIDGLFPTFADLGKPFQAMAKYRNDFRDMLGEYSPEALLPRLDAGGPEDMKAMEAALAEVEVDFRSRILNESGALSEGEITKLRELKYKKMVELLKKHAESIHVYADMTADGAPFELLAWSQPGVTPTIEDIWEGQMSLWIQQDIAQAIADVNRVEDPKSNVTVAPIKRILRIDVDPAYVGINGGGLLLPNSRGSGPTEEAKADQPMLDDFSIAPTGRRSNAIYDVRHAQVDLVVDFQRLPEFIDYLSKVNFMTVLKVDLNDVDEYQDLRNGYVYGSDDAVHASIVIESVWLRKWTKDYMPKNVRLLVGAERPPEVQN